MTIYDLKEQFQQLETPFYYYDTELLDRTLEVAKQHAAILPQAHLHFAVKANANPVVLRHIKEAGLGADCVSGGEIERCLEVGIPANKIGKQWKFKVSELDEWVKSGKSAID